jgi:phospholipid/cholesterol/gamma-HCH transport system substrate-binding protein
MQTQAPSLGRILVAIGFALSCFGLILFLWIAFGGPIPLKAKSYRITAYFPAATQLAIESDVRIGGVSVGKVKAIQVAPPDERVAGQDTTQATIEIEPQFAPISSDAHAILRQKTLLGETYVELTSGSKPGRQVAPVSLGSAATVSDSAAKSVHSIPEGGTLGIGQTQNATQIDDIFNALDKQTRDAFRRWQANAAVAINGRSVDFNDALGNLGPFVTDASSILGTLRRQRVALHGLVRDTGTVFQALSERNQELAGAITGSDRTFGALARENQALAESFKILPVFENESRLTLARLDKFQANTRPLIQKLLPVANDISPTLHSVRELSPKLKSLFIDLKPLIRASHMGFPAAGDFIGGLRPVLDSLDPFLANLNPVIRFLGFYKSEITNFLTGPPAGLAGTLSDIPGQAAPRHVLRQLTYISPESLSVYPTRTSTNRGNDYLPPNVTSDPRTAAAGIFPNFDCNPTKGQPGADAQGQVTSSPPVSEALAPCIIQRNVPAKFGGKRFSDIFADP